jgi:putative glutamine amidotransferase
MDKKIIGICEDTKYDNYFNWLKEDENFEIIKLSYRLHNFNEIEKCHGIMLSGGSDVHPGLYNQPDFVKYMDPAQIDEKRDEFEWEVLQHTEDSQKPVLAICRGMQIMNIFLGGTLIPDIPSFGKFNHDKYYEGKDRVHKVMVDPNSMLCNIVGQKAGVINSAHHQAVDKPGFDLVVNALSPDGVIEGMERRDPEGKSWLLLVQWHPERMADKESDFAKKIRQSFLDAVRKYEIVDINEDN